MYVMKLDVYAHCSIDHISTGGKTSILAGGSACYCGIMAANLGSNVHLVSRYGDDCGTVDLFIKHLFTILFIKGLKIYSSILDLFY